MQSEFTLVTAGCSKPTQRLPGVSKRRSDHTVLLSGRQYMIAPPTPRFEIENSTWNERAWTYQEAILSRRQLVLLKGQVYYKCQRMHCFESLTGFIKPERTSVSGSVDSTIHRWNEFVVFLNLSAQEDPLKHIYIHLAEYTKRTLSYPDDILNAIAGVAMQFRALYPALQFVSGIPIIARKGSKASAQEQFLAGLCWKTAFVCERRSGFPNWSWAGWYSALPFVEEPVTNIQEIDGLRLTTEDDGINRLIEGASRGQALWPFPLLHQLKIHGPILNIHFERWLEDARESVLPYGKALIVFDDLHVEMAARFFPPTYQRPSKAEPWKAVALGERKVLEEEKMRTMMVMLVVQSAQKKGHGVAARVGLLEVDLKASRLDEQWSRLVKKQWQEIRIG